MWILRRQRDAAFPAHAARHGNRRAWLASELDAWDAVQLSKVKS
jgi:predicted DNA-binding transcriptional regulator AlpA